MFPYRKLCTLIFNVNVAKEERLAEYQYMPFPSDYAQIELDNFVDSVRAEMELQAELTPRE